jgi:hypothetical protein
MRGEDEVRGFPVSKEQSGREVKRIQRPEDRRERLSGASEDHPVELHDVDVSERPKEHLSPIGDLLVGHERTKAMPIEGAEALDLRQCTRHSPFDRLPLGEVFPLTEDDPEKNRRIDIGDHRWL